MITFSTIKNEDYMVIVREDDKSKIYAYRFQNGEPILYFQMRTDCKITGCVATEKGVILTKEDSDKIYDMSQGNCVEYYVNKKSIIVNRLNTSDLEEHLLMNIDGTYMIYDLKTKKVVCENLPYSDGLTDMQYSDNNEIVMLTNSIFEYDDDELHYKIVVLDKSYSPTKYTGEAIYEDWGEIRIEEIKQGMHYPLFSKYLYNYPLNICISAQAGCYLQWIEEHIILVGSIIDSNCVFIVEIPEEITREATFYYNEEKQFLYITEDDKLIVYCVDYNRGLYEELNTMYKNHTGSLQNSFMFNRLFYKCLESTKLKTMYENDI